MCVCFLARFAGFTLKSNLFAATRLRLFIHTYVSTHPSTHTHARWNLQSYASAGFATLGVNFRGSTGFGHAFTRAISAKGPDAVGWNVGGEDTIAAVEHALKKHANWIDAERVVGLGASYGAHIASCMMGMVERVWDRNQ